MQIPKPSKTPNPLEKHFAIIYWLFISQISLTIGIVLIFFFWKGLLWGISALLGGGIALLPEIFFIVIYFRKTFARSANKVLNAFFVAEAVKWLVTIGLFTVSFQWSKLKPLPLFITFIVTQFAYWLVPLIYEYSVRIHTTSSRAPHAKNKLGDV